MREMQPGGWVESCINIASSYHDIRGSGINFAHICRNSLCQVFTWHMSSLNCLTGTNFTGLKTVGHHLAVSGPKYCKDFMDRCPESLNLQSRIQEKIKGNVDSWGDCAELCVKDPDCGYWVYHRKNATKFQKRCVTMSGYETTKSESNYYSGSRECLGENSSQEL